MILLQAEHLKKTHGAKVVFDDITLYINSGDKIGLIGINGTGKSTLLKILAGFEESDAGEITTGNELVIEYLPQQIDFDEEATVLEQIFRGESSFMVTLRQYEKALLAVEQAPDNAHLTEELLRLSAEMERIDAWQLESEAKAILNKLGIHQFDAKVGTLSGGQRKRIALAGALIRPCNLLILDEPTNHLDNSAIEYLEGVLKNKACALLMVTHDRYFLDRVTNTIVEIDQGNLYRYEGNYSTFLEQKAQREAISARMQEKERSLYKKELEWIRKGAEARRTKQKARIERFHVLEGQLENRPEEKLEINMTGARLGKKIIEMDNLQKAMGEKILLKDFSYHVVPSDRIGIIGDNGLGKSTLLNLIAGVLTPDGGSVAVGDTVRLGYYTQDNRQLDPEMRVIDYIREKGEYITTSDGTLLSAAKMLERFLFPGNLQYAKIGKLSGGEKRRLYLLGVLMQDCNVLLLDEPTNDLDIQTLQILEDFLDHFAGPVLAVSHDRYFLDRICERIFAFEGGGKVTIFTGSYSDYAATFPKEAPIKENVKVKKEDSRQRGESKLKFTYKEAKEYETIEDDIARLEAESQALDEAINVSGSDFIKLSELVKQKEAIEQELLNKMDRWAYLTELAEKIAAQTQ